MPYTSERCLGYTPPWLCWLKLQRGGARVQRQARVAFEPTPNHERPLRTGPRRFERGCGCAHYCRTGEAPSMPYTSERCLCYSSTRQHPTKRSGRDGGRFRL